MKSRYASDGQGRQVQREGKTPRRVAKVIGSVENQVRRAAIPDVETVLHSPMFLLLFCHEIYEHRAPLRYFLRILRKDEGLIYPFLASVS